jgi:hypothetical protein
VASSRAAEPDGIATTGARDRSLPARSRSSAAASSDPLLPVGSAAVGRESASGAGGSADGQRDWQPWSNRAGAHSDSSGDATTLLGGLARLSGSSIVGGGSTVRESPASTPSVAGSDNAHKVTPPVDPPHAAAPAPPAVGPAPPAPNPVAHVIDPSPRPMPMPMPPDAGGFTPNLPVPPTDPFHQHDTPAPAPFAPPAPTGPLGGNDPGAASLPGGASPAATPEPASLMLMATGLLAVFGELRRRRVL